jgi:hypothetical protein
VLCQPGPLPAVQPTDFVCEHCWSDMQLIAESLPSVMVQLILVWRGHRWATRSVCYACSLPRNGTTKPSQTATWRRLVCDKSGGRERPDGQPDLANSLNTNEVDCAVDAVGFEASGHGHGAGEQSADVLNSIMTVTRAGGALGIPAHCVTVTIERMSSVRKHGAERMERGLG